MKRSREPDEGFPNKNHDSACANSAETALPASKVTQLDEDDSDIGIEMKCMLPPHKDALIFRSYEDYEVHYQKAHTNRCLECRKNFPSPRFLELHIEEVHDSFVAVKRDRGEHTYSCFVEGCERKYPTPKKRRRHLIDRHMYPESFFFAITREGIDGRQSLLLEASHRASHRRRRPSMTATETRSSPRPEGVEVLLSTDESLRAQVLLPGEDDDDKSRARVPEVEMEDLTGAISALQFVPLSVHFGRGGRKAGSK